MADPSPQPAPASARATQRRRVPRVVTILMLVGAAALLTDILLTFKHPRDPPDVSRHMARLGMAAQVHENEGGGKLPDSVDALAASQQLGEDFAEFFRRHRILYRGGGRVLKDLPPNSILAAQDPWHHRDRVAVLLADGRVVSIPVAAFDGIAEGEQGLLVLDETDGQPDRARVRVAGP
jgi:hypothetical protein